MCTRLLRLFMGGLAAVSKYGLGRLVSKDERDTLYCMPLEAVQGEQISKTWSLGPVVDQRDMPHCVGFAWWSWLAASPVRQRGMAPSGIYTLAQEFDEWPGTGYEGTSVRAGAKVLQMAGLISQYLWAWDLETAATWIHQRSPIVIGTNWYEGMLTPDDKGFLNPSGRLAGGHAYLLYGVNYRREFFRVRNSWGSMWGHKGNAKISFSTFERLLAEDGECCTAEELQWESWEK